MKKVAWKIISVVCLTGVLVACGGSDKTESVTCKKDELKMKLTYSGKKVVAQEETGVINFKERGLTEKEAKSFADKMKEPYKGINGVKMSYDIKDEKLTITLAVDYEKADIDELVKAKLVSASSKGADYIGVEETKKALKTQGYSCK